MVAGRKIHDLFKKDCRTTGDLLGSTSMRTWKQLENKNNKILKTTTMIGKGKNRTYKTKMAFGFRTKQEISSICQLIWQEIQVRWFGYIAEPIPFPRNSMSYITKCLKRIVNTKIDWQSPFDWPRLSRYVKWRKNWSRHW